MIKNNEIIVIIMKQYFCYHCCHTVSLIQPPTVLLIATNYCTFVLLYSFVQNQLWSFIPVKENNFVVKRYLILYPMQVFMIER